jgi:hypothetical protein
MGWPVRNSVTLVPASHGHRLGYRWLRAEQDGAA